MTSKDDIAAILSNEIRPLYLGKDVVLSAVDFDRLKELGFRGKSFPHILGHSFWVHEVPDTFRFENYLAVVENDAGLYLMGIADHLLSSMGWKMYSFADFCDRVYFRRPDGEYNHVEAIRYIDLKMEQMIGSGAITVAEVV